MHHSTQSGYGSVLGGLQAVEPGRQAEARPRRHNAEPEEAKAEGRRPEAAGQQSEQGCGADGQGSQQLGTVQVESAHADALDLAARSDDALLGARPSRPALQTALPSLLKQLKLAQFRSQWQAAEQQATADGWSPASHLHVLGRAGTPAAAPGKAAAAVAGGAAAGSQNPGGPGLGSDP